MVLARGLEQLGDGNTVGLENAVVALKDGGADVVGIGGLILGEDLNGRPLTLVTGEEAELHAVVAGVGDLQGLTGLGLGVGGHVRARGGVGGGVTRSAGSQRTDKHQGGKRKTQDFFKHSNLLRFLP